MLAVALAASHSASIAMGGNQELDEEPPDACNFGPGAVQKNSSDLKSTGRGTWLRVKSNNWEGTENKPMKNIILKCDLTNV